MAFLVVSPALTSKGRGRLSPSVLGAADGLFPAAERRLRPSGAAVWKLSDSGRFSRNAGRGGPLREGALREYALREDARRGDAHQGDAHQGDALQGNALLGEAIRDALNALSSSHQVDAALLSKPYRWQDFSVLAMDMDSTVITIECIDEIADFCGKKDEVSAITEAAMRGEIKDYAESLRRRVHLLAGLDAGVLQEVIRYRLKFTPGAKELVAAANAHGIHTLLVSGGFTQFTDFVAKKIGFKQTRSNTLEIADGRLTGRVVGKIVDASVKKATMLAACRSHGVGATRAIAIGDGANDLKMMGAAGLSIAHRAKPTVAAQAMHAIAYGGLDNILDWFE